MSSLSATFGKNSIDFELFDEFLLNFIERDSTLHGVIEDNDCFGIFLLSFRFEI